MTAKGTIRTDWAALSRAVDGRLILSLKRNGTPVCLQLESLEELNGLLRDRRLCVKRWAMAVPGRLCITKRLTLPASDLTEAAQMIPFELPSLVPLSMEEVVYGCTSCGAGAEMMDVLVYILRLSRLQEYLEPYAAIGIEPQRVIPDTLAVHMWVDGVDTQPARTIVSAVADTQLCLVVNSVDGCFQDASELPLFPADRLLSARRISEELAQQRNRVAPEGRDDVALICAADRELLRAMEEESIPGAFTGPGRPRLIPTPEVPLYSDGGSLPLPGRYGFEGAVAMGLLRAATESRFPRLNLLPQQCLRKRARRDARRRYAVSGILALLSIAGLWSVLAATNWRTAQKAAILLSEISPIKASAGAVEGKRQRVQVIQKQLAGRECVLQLFEDLYTYTPEAISISDISFVAQPEGISIELRGHADLLATAFGYATAMAKAPLLGDIQIIDAQQTPRPEGSVVEFKAHCTVKTK